MLQKLFVEDNNCSIQIVENVIVKNKFVESEIVEGKGCWMWGC